MHNSADVNVTITVFYDHEEYFVNTMQSILSAMLVRPAVPRPFRYHEEDLPKNVAHKVYPAYHEEDPPRRHRVSHDVMSAVAHTSHQWAPLASAMLVYVRATFDMVPTYDFWPAEDGYHHEARLEKCLSMEAVDLHSSDMTSSEPTTPLKGAQSIDCIDLATSGLPAADAGLKAAQSVGAVHKMGLRRNYFSFEDKLLAHLKAQSSDMMTFDEIDNWSQGSFESSVASTADGSVRRPADMPSNILAGKSSGCEKPNLQSASRRGLSHSMILTWLSNKRYVPINEPIKEGGAVDVAGVRATSTGSPNTHPTSLSGISLTGTGIPNQSVTGTGLTATATTMVTGSGGTRPTSQDMDAKKKMTMNYRELNAVSPSYW